MEDSNSDLKSWLLLAFSLLANILGSLMIYFDLIYNAITKSNYSILKSHNFIGTSLAISSGTLLMACFNAILVKSETYIIEGGYTEKQANLIMVPTVLFGVVLCLVLNYVVMKISSKSVLTFPHSHDPNGTESEINEHTNLLHGSHHHHITDLLTIGVQTIAGIAIHRIPEGLLLFSTSRADKELGSSLYLAMSVHSYSEGFAIATPLYGALKNRGLVLAVAILLGCVPQIIGAFIGYLLFRNQEKLSVHEELMFGLFMCIAAGFMVVVCVQMIGSAHFYMTQKRVVWGVVFGVLLTFGCRAI